MTEHWSVLGEFVAREWNFKKKGQRTESGLKNQDIQPKLTVFSWKMYPECKYGDEK